MPNIEHLESQISDLSNQYISISSKANFLLLLLSRVEHNETSGFYTNYSVNQDILDIKKSIFNYIASLDTVLTDREVKNIALEECMLLKDKIVSIYENIYRYFTVWNSISTLARDEMAIRNYKESNKDEHNLDFNMYYNDCFEFLNATDDSSEQKLLMGQLFKCLPFKISRDKYFDIVKESLSKVLSHETKESIDISLNTFKNSCTSKEEDSYGLYFTDIANSIESLRDIKPSDLSHEDLDNYYTDLDTVYDSLLIIEEFFKGMFNDINSLIILFYLNYTLDDLVMDNFSLKDIYNKVREIIENNNLSEDHAFKEILTSMLEENIEPLLDKANEINKKEISLLEKIDSLDVFTNDTKNLLITEGFIRSTFYSDLNDELFNFNIDKNFPIADESYKEEKINEFICYIKGYFSSLPTHTRKTSMQMLLSALPLPYTVIEFMDYVKYSLDNAKSFEEKLLIVDKSGMVFRDSGFDFNKKHKTINHHHEKNYSCAHTNNHHQHSEKCSCNHHHH